MMHSNSIGTIHTFYLLLLWKLYYLNTIIPIDFYNFQREYIFFFFVVVNLYEWPLHRNIIVIKIIAL